MTRRNSLGQWMADFRWAMNMMRVRRFRRTCGFSNRMAFDRALQPIIGEPDHKSIVAYPDAVYHISVDDVIRAMRVSQTVRDL